MTAARSPLPNPAHRVRVLFVANLLWFGLTFSLLYLFSSGGDAAGMGIFYGLCALFAMVVGSIILGLLALNQVWRHPEQASFKIRLLAWLILLTPSCSASAP